MKKHVANAQDIGSMPKRARNAIIRRGAPTLAKTRPEFAMKQLKRPIFILGCHRSGTTLLGRLLDMHKDIANWTEANEIWDPGWFPWREENLDKPPLEYDPAGFMARWWSENEHRMDEIKAMFGAFQFLHSKPTFMNKTPYNVFRIPQLVEHFPDARFVYIMRDGRAVVNSHTKKIIHEEHLKEWPPKERELFEQSTAALAEQLGRYWKASVDEVTHQNEVLGLEEKGVMYSTTYTNLCDDTMGVLTEICEFLDLAPDRFLEGIEDQNITNSNTKWRKGLDDETVERMVAAMEPALTANDFTD